MLTRTVLILLSLSPLASSQTASKPSGAPGPAPQAILHTTAGDMRCTLFPDKAPKAVANFIGLAQGTKDWRNPVTGATVHGKPLYDGVIFHRVIPEFMIQGGDPSGTGAGNVGFEFEDELHADLLYDRPGRMGLANRGPNTNSSQFFITEVPYPSLNPNRELTKGYTIFGQCDSKTVDLVKKIARMPCQGGVPCDGRNSRLQTPVTITHVEIVGGSGSGHAATDSGKAQPQPSPKAPQ